MAPDGRRIGVSRWPEQAVNFAFGRPDLRTLFCCASGALSAGSRLPSSRDLAARLGTARASVIAGYEQLVAEGYAEARPGSGTFVCADLANLI